MRSASITPQFILVAAVALLAACSADEASPADTRVTVEDTDEGDTVKIDNVADTVAVFDTLLSFHDTLVAADTVQPPDARFDTRPAERACEEASDCTWCATPKAPSASPTCRCFECNAGVVPVADCEANAAAWRELCDGRDADGGLCPELECKPPGPVECRGAACGAVAE